MVSKQGGEPGFPVSYRFVAQLLATDQEQLYETAQAQFEQESEEHNLENNVGRHLEKVERRAGALVEAAATMLRTISRIAEIRIFRRFSGFTGLQ